MSAVGIAGVGEAFDTVLVVDFGAQYAQLIARRVRECHVYSEIVPPTMSVADMLAKRPKAVILSGGPKSVYSPGAPAVPAGLFDTGVPTLGICYGHQAMAQSLGGTVARTEVAEYGGTALAVTAPGVLFADLPTQQQVWMSHGDTVTREPPGFRVTATTPATPVAGFEAPEAACTACSFTPRWCIPRAGSTYSNASSTTRPAAAPPGRWSALWKRR